MQPPTLDRVKCQEIQRSAALNSTVFVSLEGSEACFLPQLSMAKSVSTNYTPLLVTTGFMAPETATSPCAGVSVWQNYKSHLSTSDSVHKHIRPQQRILAVPHFYLFFFYPKWFSLWIAVSYDMPLVANIVQGDVENDVAAYF